MTTNLFPEIMFHDKQIPNYDDTIWDTMEPAQREKLALDQAINATVFAKTFVPFYKLHLSRFSEKNIRDIRTLEEFACTIPQTTKQHLATRNSRLFLPDLSWIDSHDLINKGTGGTTSHPVTIWYTQYDWEAMAQHIARSIKYDFRGKLDSLVGMKILGLYHGDHVTNSVYRSGLKTLGMQLIGRVSTKADPSHNYNFLQEIEPNGILAPPEDLSNRQTKGITLDAVFELDAKNTRKVYRLNQNHNPNFKMVLWSSMPLSDDIYRYMSEDLCIPYIQGQYGSTECCPTAATCEYDPLNFHLGYGPNLVTIVRPDNKGLVEEDQEGYITVTKTGGILNQETIVPTGTNLINFRTGDYAFLKKQVVSCKCGRTTPILHKLSRKESLEIKAEFGCQVD